MCETNLMELSRNENIRDNLRYLKEFLKDPANVQKFKQLPGYSNKLIASFLDNEDPKVRKNAVTVMGLLSEKEFSETIADHYFREKTLFVKSAYLNALVSYDYSPYASELEERRKYLENGNFDEADLKHVAAELKVLQKMTEKKTTGHKEHIFRNPSEPVEVIFTAPGEFRQYLSKELKASGGKDVHEVFCGVMAKSSDIKKLSSVRIYKDMFFPVNNMKSVCKADIPAAVCHGNLFEILDRLHVKAEYPFYFRLTAKDMDLSDIAVRIQTLSGQKLVNSVSDYEAELRIIPGNEQRYGIFLKLRTRKDRRFAYRINTVATSMSTVNAAFTVYTARNFMKENAQIIDPFCGVGTLLIERAKSVKAGFMYGTDTFGTAISYARENAEKAGLDINYINRNYFDFTSGYLFDEIITEMPRTEKEEADEFYRKFFYKSDKLLKDDGIMIIVSREMGLVKKYIRLMKKYGLLLECPLGSRDGSVIYVIKKESRKYE